MSRLHKLIYLAMLVAISLVIYIVELQLPSLIPVPGVKLGLANVVSLCALLIYGPSEAIIVLLLRVLLGSMLTGQMVSLAFSLSGGLLSLLCMIVLNKYFSNYISLWAISIAGGVCHNIGQLFVASIIIDTLKIYYYLPILLISGVITGYFIGLAANFISKHLKKMRIY